MYSFLLISHIIISFLLILLTSFIVIRSILGIYNKFELSYLIDIRISIFTVYLLYIELILGLILYAIYLRQLTSLITQENANIYFSARFWAIEHTILMIFAIIFGHIGLLYAKNLSENKQIFQKKSLYFGISLILIIISISMNMIRNV
tara:strand:- start:19771 stop:20214 length:444 start_codon:yes stop_codon:yes gene_type:complete